MFGNKVSWTRHEFLKQQIVIFVDFTLIHQTKHTNKWNIDPETYKPWHQKWADFCWEL